MAQFTFRTYTQSSGPESFISGDGSVDLIKIPVVELLAACPGLAINDTILIRNKSGGRRYSPEVSYIYSDATVTAGNLDVAVDGAAANILIAGASMATGPIRTQPTIAGYTYALNNVTPDAGSAVLFKVTTVPVGTGNIYVQLGTIPVQP